MTPGERSWLERMVAQWGELAAQTRRIACTRQSALNRAGGLEEVVAGLQARLDAAPAPIVAAEPAIVAPDLPPTGRGDFGEHQAEVEALACQDPIWFMRSRRYGMIYSAMVCRRDGDHATAERYEERARRAPAVDGIIARLVAIAAAPVRPPRPIEPFVAGPQLDMFA